MSTNFQPPTAQPPTTQPLTGKVEVVSANKATTLSNEEILRYSRHLIMPEVGMDGQLKLKNAKVLLIGTGGLGAPLGLYLTAAGVGRRGSSSSYSWILRSSVRVLMPRSLADRCRLPPV